MKQNDFLLCTFEGDTNTPPIQYAPEITEVNTSDKTFNCTLSETGQHFKFHYSSDPNELWTGTDDSAASYTLATHQVLSGGNIDPQTGGLAIVTFGDGQRYMCYVDNIDPSIDVVFYFAGTPALSFENNKIIKSTWDKYPENSDINSIEGCVANDEIEESGTSEGVPETGAASDSSATTAASSKYLFVDLYSLDLKGNPAWDVLVKTPDFYGAIIKATQGVKGWSNDKGWFKKNWVLLKDVGGERYGTSWFRGAYLFLNFWDDGAKQADHYLDTIADAGGWDKGDIIPIVDVELGNDGKNGKPRNRNNDANAQQIIDCTTACAERLRSVTGRSIMLYGRGAMRERSITSKMGCDVVWNPSYSATMITHGLEAWTLDDIALWQYCGDGVAYIDEKKFPRSIPDFGKVDISVYIDGSRKPTFESMISRLGINTVQ